MSFSLRTFLQQYHREPEQADGRTTYGIIGRICTDHLTPPEQEALERALLAKTAALKETPPGPVNERPFGWARVAFDIDCEKPNSPEQEELYELSAREIVRLVVETLEMEFCARSRSSCALLRSGLFRYRILTQMLYPNYAPQAALMLFAIVKQKLHDRGWPIAEKMVNEWFDDAPLRMSHLRLHGTTNSTGNPESVYMVAYVHPASNGERFDISYITIFPSSAELLHLMRSPDHPVSYLRGHTAFTYRVAGSERDRACRSLASKQWLSGPEILDRAFNKGTNSRMQVKLLSTNSCILHYTYDPDDVDEHCVIDERPCQRYRALAMVRCYPNDTAAFVTLYCECCERWTTEVPYAQHMFMREEEEGESASSAIYYHPCISQVQLPGRGDVFLYESFVASDLQVPLACEVYPRGFVVPVKREGKYTAVLADPDQPRDFTAITANRYGVRDLAIASCARAGCALTRAESDAITEVSHRRTSAQGIDLRTDPSGKSRCSIAFNDVDVLQLNRNLVPRPLRVVTISAPCDSGKTYHLVQSALALRAVFPRFRVLLVGPRISLVAKLAADFAAGLGVPPWTYAAGRACPADQVVCSSTLDSLARAIRDASGAVQRFTMVVCDEVETSMRHICASDTLAKTPASRLELLTVLDTVCAAAHYVFYADKDMHGLSRRFQSLPIVKLKQQSVAAGEPMRPVHVCHLSLEDAIRVSEFTLGSYEELVQGVLDVVQKGERAIVFEPLPDQADALAALVRRSAALPEDGVLVIKGATSASQKRAFSGDPLAALGNNVKLLVHTTAIGVGISIEGEVFHRRFLVYRGGLLTDQVSQQAIVRARSVIGDSANTRSVYVWYEPRIKHRILPLLQRPTLATAIADANWMLASQRQFHIALSPMLLYDPLTARMRINANDPYAVFIIHALATEKLAIDVQQFVIQHRRVDSWTASFPARIAVDRSSVRTNCGRT